jgi:hypothetical protein
MLDCLPPGPSRLARPATVIRYTFERFEAPMDPLGRTWDRLPVIPIEAVQPGDTQVFAAREPVKFADPLIDLDVLADIPSVDSIISSTRMQASRDNPHIRELLFSTGAPAPPPASLRHLTGLSSIHLRFGSGSHRLDLASLPADQMRKLAINR